MKKFILLIIEKIRKALKIDEKGNSFWQGTGMLLLVTLMITGCEYYEDPSNDYSSRFKTVYIDSCEWLMSKYTYEIAHKGNCRFCKERRQKELEELVIKLKEK